MKMFRLSLLIRKLADFLQSGIPLYRGVGLLARQAINQQEHVWLSSIQADIEEGHALAHVFGSRPKEFSPILVSLAQAGEASGALDVVLERMAGLLENEAESRRRFLSALIYPAFLLTLAGGVCIFIVGYVVPRFIPLFEEFGQQLPWPTRVLMMSARVSPYLMGILFVAGVAVGYALIKKQKSGVVHRIMTLPLIGHALKTFSLERWTFVMSTLLESAITLPHALRVSRTSFGNLLFSNEIDLLSKRIEGGESFSGALKQSPIFPEEISEIVAAAEESGQLAQAFTRLSQTYKKETEVSRQVALAMIEPALIVVMGLIVGFVALALLLPMMELNGAIR